MSILKVINIKKHFYDGSRILEVLKGIDLTVEGGESIAIMGASGSGKSTFLHLVGALDRPTEGSITLDGKNYDKMNSYQLADIRNRRIGFIFQFHHLLPEFTALENVVIPTLMKNDSGSTFDAMHDKARAILKKVGMGDRLHHRPVKLSGGEQQRVALCRALINEPLLVLADEPTGDLDLATGDEVIDVIWKHTVDAGRSLIMVTHNPDIAARADRVLELRDGLLHNIEKT